MFGSLGGSEVILLFVLALLLFGPRRLPEIGRTLGKTISDFRRATQDFKTSLEREVQLDKLKDATRVLESNPLATLARGAILDPAVPTPPADEPSPTPAPQTPEDKAPASDGGTGSIH